MFIYLEYRVWIRAVCQPCFTFRISAYAWKIAFPATQISDYLKMKMWWPLPIFFGLTKMGNGLSMHQVLARTNMLNITLRNMSI